MKRTWYKLRHPNSYFNNSPKFWNTETGLAFLWEKKIAKLLKAIHLEFNKGADLEWNGKMVDVKVAHKWRSCWVFNRNSRKKKIDFFFCIALKRPIRYLLIPNKDFPKSGITIGLKSKYDKFLFM